MRIGRRMAGRLLGWGAAALVVAPARAAPAFEVMIDNFTFAPIEIVVPVGATVTWTNRDDIPHTVTDAARPKEVRSKVLDTDDQYSRQFDTAGQYGYFCSLHAHMQGTVVVR